VNKRALFHSPGKIPPVWREYIQSLGVEAEFATPATEQQIEQAARELGVRFPDDLVALLRETNGVEGESGDGFIWPIERIVSDNLTFRASFHDIYMPFDALLFFGDAGNGDQFAFPITSKGPKDRVFVWGHEDDGRNWYADSLRQYLEWWPTGARAI
jgi:hypothetical protein